MKAILFFLIFLTISIRAQNVGINTAAPQDVFHIDAGKNNNNTVPTSATVTDDFVVTSKGKIGIGTITPRSTVEIATKDISTTSTVAEGILVPRVTRERAKAMTGVEAGTIIFVNDITGAGTDNSTGSAFFIDHPGLYYFDGLRWAAFETTYDKATGEQGGVSIRKIKWIGDVTNSTSEELTCGKFKFRIYKESATSYRVQWNLANPSSITIQGAYRNIYNDGSSKEDYRDVSRNFTTTSVFETIVSTNDIPTNDIHDFWVTYPGDLDFYNITFARIENSAGVGDNLNVITCKRY